MWDFPALRFDQDSDIPVPGELGDLEAGAEVAASSLCRGREKCTMCELKFPFGISG